MLDMKAVMTVSPQTVEADATVESAQKMMAERRFRHLPVMHNGQVIGLLSDRDITMALVAHHGMLKGDEIQVEEVCTLDAYSVSPDAKLDEVVTRMGEKQIGSVLVLDEGKLAGIFTATDACLWLGKALRGEI